MKKDYKDEWAENKINEWKKPFKKALGTSNTQLSQESRDSENTTCANCEHPLSSHYATTNDEVFCKDCKADTNSKIDCDWFVKKDVSEKAKRKVGIGENAVVSDEEMPKVEKKLFLVQMEGDSEYSESILATISDFDYVELTPSDLELLKSALLERADTQKQLDKLEKALDKEAHRLLKIEDKEVKGAWRSKHASSFTIKINVMRILHDWEREFGVGRTEGSTDREALLKKLGTFLPEEKTPKRSTEAVK